MTDEWWYAEDGGLTQVDGQWLHLPADEAGELLLCLCCLFPCLALAAEADTAVPGADIVATIIGWLPESWGQWITFIVTICAAISAVWPRPADDANVVVRFIYVSVTALGFNAGKAQNADDAAASRRL